MKTREEISKNWTAVIQIHNRTYHQAGEVFRLPTDLTGELDATGRMFEDMRYFYEGGDFAKHWFLSPLPDLLRSLILVLKDGTVFDDGALVSTNIYEKQGERWLMVSHQAQNVPK